MASKKPKTKDPNPITTSAAGSSAQPTTGGSALARPGRQSGLRRSGGMQYLGGNVPMPRPAPAAPPSAGQSGASPAPHVTGAPMDPLAPMSLADMIKQATAIATAQIQPGVNAVNQEQQMGQSAHDTRGQQLQGWADYAQGNLNSAFTDTRNALNDLATRQGNVDQASKDSLAAALRQGTGSTDAAAKSLGATSPTNLSGVLQSSSDSAKNLELGAGSGSGALLGLMGANRSLPSTGLAQNQEIERQRWNAQQQGFSQRRNDLAGQVPGLVQSSLKDQQQFELAKGQFGETKANDLFQQYLAEQNLSLKKKDQTFQQWLGRTQIGETQRSNLANEGQAATNATNQNAIDWANVGINRTQAEGTLYQLRHNASKETDAKKKAAIQARGAAMEKGLQWLGGYLAPAKGQSTSTHTDYPYGAAQAPPVDDPNTGYDETQGGKAPGTTQYQRTFDDALRGLTNYMSRSDALRLLAKSDYSDWRTKASQTLSKLKRRPLQQTIDNSQAPGGKRLPRLTKSPQGSN